MAEMTIGQLGHRPGLHVDVNLEGKLLGSQLFWVHPDEFRWLREQGEALGFGSVSPGPLVRSSDRADEQHAGPLRIPPVALTGGA